MEGGTLRVSRGARTGNCVLGKMVREKKNARDNNNNKKRKKWGKCMRNKKEININSTLEINYENLEVEKNWGK